MGNVLKKSLFDQNRFLSQFPFTVAQLANVRTIGLALHEGRGIGAAKYGEIVVTVDDADEKEIEYAEWSEEGARGSAAGSGQRQQGPQAPPDPADTVVGWRRAFYKEQLKEVAENYPGSTILDDNFGHWFAVPVFPAGEKGPQALILIAVPDDIQIPIRSWAFWTTDELVAWIGHRHTNYPDGSVCAFPPDGGHWQDGVRLILYIDRVCEWIARHLFLWAEGYWPGPQEGPIHRYYRLTTGLPFEKCFCGSNSTYFECCRSHDLFASRSVDKAEFMEKSGGVNIAEQRPHKQVFAYALGKRKNAPNMSQVHPAIVEKTGRKWRLE